MIIYGDADADAAAGGTVAAVVVVSYNTYAHQQSSKTRANPDS